MAIISGVGAGAAPAAPFTVGNVVIYRVGDGSAPLVGNTATAAFLDEYSTAAPSAGPVQSVAFPTAVSGANRRLTASGTATSEGLISRSTNGRFVLATGYDAAVGTTPLTSTASTAVNRVIGVIDNNATVDTSTALTDGSSGNNPRSAASTDGTDLFFTGGAGGVRYTTRGATTSTQLSTTTTNLRAVGIFGGQLFASSQSGATRLATVGTGTPTTAGQTITNIAGVDSTVLPNPYAYAFFDLSTSVSGLDTAYVADEDVGLRKLTFDGTTWLVDGTVGGNADDYRGVTGFATGGTVTLYATRTASQLVAVTDPSGYDGTFAATPTLLATAPANTAFRGVAFTPIAATGVSWRGGKARVAGDGVVVSWKAGRDAETAGYEVLRARKGAGKRVTVSRRLIVGGGTGAYRFRDAAGDRGDRYFVVARATDGTREVHGPLVARTSNRKAAR